MLPETAYIFSSPAQTGKPPQAVRIGALTGAVNQERSKERLNHDLSYEERRSWRGNFTSNDS
jgi:hypothetical protein